MTQSPKIAAVGQALGLAAVALAVLMLVGLALGPRTGRYRTMTVLSASMRPTIPEGSVIVQTPIALSEVRVGDVITYRIPVEDHRVVTHRVVKVIEGGASPVLRTKGDASRSADPWVARLAGEKVWRVKASVPMLGHALQPLRQPAAKRVSLMLVPLLLAIVWLRDIWAPRPRPGAAAGAVLVTGAPRGPNPWLTPGAVALAALGAVAMVAGRRGRRG